MSTPHALISHIVHHDQPTVCIPQRGQGRSSPSSSLLTARSRSALVRSWGNTTFSLYKFLAYMQSQCKRPGSQGAKWCSWLYRCPYTNLCIQKLTVQIFAYAGHLYCRSAYNIVRSLPVPKGFQRDSAFRHFAHNRAQTGTVVFAMKRRGEDASLPGCSAGRHARWHSSARARQPAMPRERCLLYTSPSPRD